MTEATFLPTDNEQALNQIVNYFFGEDRRQNSVTRREGLAAAPQVPKEVVTEAVWDVLGQMRPDREAFHSRRIKAILLSVGYVALLGVGLYMINTTRLKKLGLGVAGALGTFVVAGASRHLLGLETAAESFNTKRKRAFTLLEEHYRQIQPSLKDAHLDKWIWEHREGWDRPRSTSTGDLEIWMRVVLEPEFSKSQAIKLARALTKPTRD